MAIIDTHVLPENFIPLYGHNENPPVSEGEATPQGANPLLREIVDRARRLADEHADNPGVVLEALRQMHSAAVDLFYQERNAQ